ncbi:TetR/AcrR family transcriptional regulator [Paenibacillus sp. MMS20-IR301]|uniref:TetR/AcrR family transcriptional regulator n=1 Tax=Paenibacillus sp. MMS20-IR301 TaxID=2895946 RepID=UPI0028E32AE8|nr:TetR/AcrR family transcriptional regulator [Paenibacillus sp. MMS20-IR301]WNS45039.1 TetR/AcrR family transcriptional regulator [Paenibacillus sp. MMS20-IR301]
MGREQKQEQEREAMRRLILATAAELAAENGLDKLSVRKIAGRMEYSAGIIYHYFQGKEEIVEQLLQQGYQKMISGMDAQVQLPAEQMSAEDKFKYSLTQFIRMGIAERSPYSSIMLNSSPAVLSLTAVLHQGAAQERSAIGMLCSIIGELEGRPLQKAEVTEKTAQVIWSAAFGLIIRLNLEKNLPEAQKEALIDRLVEGMLIIARS